MSRVVGLLCVFCLMAPCAAPQEWRWVEVPEAFSPSLVTIDSVFYHFLFLDWDGDGLLDLLVNDDESLRRYERAHPDSDRWYPVPFQSPRLPRRYRYGGEGPAGPWDRPLPCFFTAVDLDKDGDWDIVADGLQLCENVGSNDQPVWQEQSTFFTGRLPALLAPCFRDFDGDGNLELLARDPMARRFRLFRYAAHENSWLSVDEPLETLYRFLLDKVPWYSAWFSDIYLSYLSLGDVDDDDDYDAILVHRDLPPWGTGVPSFLTFSCLAINTGSNESPEWALADSSQWSEGHFMEYADRGMDWEIQGQLVDFDGDLDLDYVFMAPNRHLKLLENLSPVAGGICFAAKDTYLGRLNVQMAALPFLYPRGDSLPPLLIVGENYLGPSPLWPEYATTWGRLRTFGEWGNLDHDYQVREWCDITRRLGDWPKDLRVSFVDLPDSLTGMVVAFSTVRTDEARVRFYRTGAPGKKRQWWEHPLWEQEPHYLSFFDRPAEKFRDLHLVDLDGDGTMEVLTLKDGLLACYRNEGSLASPSWCEASEYISGLTGLPCFHFACGDLDLHGDQDVVLGNEDGTLSLFINDGPCKYPRFRAHLQAFAGIDVGADAAPALGDMDGDGRLDLIVGNRSGFLYYFRNESTVGVGGKPRDRESSALPSLGPCYPNPLRTATSIAFRLGQTGPVELEVYNVLGMRVRTLMRGHQSDGTHRITWDGCDQSGQPVPAGVYLGRLVAGPHICTCKIAVVR